MVYKIKVLYVIISELSKLTNILTDRNNYLNCLNLVYDGIGILESQYKTDNQIKEYFFKIVSEEAKFFCNLLSTTQGFPPLTRVINAKKQAFFRKIIKLMRNEFKNSNKNKKYNETLDSGCFNALNVSCYF